MDLFGMKEHEQQHKDLEKHVRRLVEQVAQLTIDLGETRMQLRELAIEVEGKVSTDEIDPALVGLNDGIRQAREQLSETQEANEQTWDKLSDDLDDAVEVLRERFS
jgi:ABC-type transporter Mla subunit MlaD